ncbi:MAG: PfkB family carbohydrate kinase [Planctomycetia bacterium]|nr:PfkB family carbohydrate kinase [Planctomycetia bacterium]
MLARTLIVVGSVALDTVETPFGRNEAVLGGSATYFSYAASFRTPVRLVGVVGEDFPAEYRSILEQRDIDLSGLETRAGATFRWEGSYEDQMNVAKTIEVDLNVLEHFKPELSAEFRKSSIVFLANGSPDTQLAVLEQVEDPKLAVADTMNFWIETAHDELVDLLGRLDGLFLNDEEARLLTRTHNLLLAAEKVLELGPWFVVIKKGEHGALLVTKEQTVSLPAFPCRKVVDPTGAGDSFAGGMMGYLATQEDSDFKRLKSAMACGMVTASFAVEDFSLWRFQQIDLSDIDRRLDVYKRMLQL